VPVNKKATRRWLFCFAKSNYLEAAAAAAAAAASAGAEASAAGAEAGASAAGAGAATGAGAGAGASSFLPQAARAAAAITAASTRVLFICKYLKVKRQFPEIVDAVSCTPQAYNADAKFAQSLIIVSLSMVFTLD
jgi:hypothetical protein